MFVRLSYDVAESVGVDVAEVVELAELGEPIGHVVRVHRASTDLGVSS